MEKRNLCALGRMVMVGKEHLLLVRPMDGLLALTMLNFAEKVKAIDPFLEEVGEATFSAAEIKLTETLVDASLIEDFDFEKYENTYTSEMRSLIQAKVDGEEMVTAPDREEPQILNLMDALKRSVSEAQMAAAPVKRVASARTRPAKKAAAKKNKMAKSTKARKPAAKKKTG